MAPLVLTGLRKQDPNRERKYRLPAAQILCPLAFALANIIVYVSGFSTLFWLTVFIAAGFVLFLGYQATLPREKRTILNFMSGWWIIPWIGSLLLISWAGRYDGSPPKVFGVTLLATQKLGNWWDLLVVAAMSMVIYFIATNSGLPTEKVQEAVAEVETEASVELEVNLAG